MYSRAPFGLPSSQNIDIKILIFFRGRFGRCPKVAVFKSGAPYSTDFSHVYIIDFGFAKLQLSGAPRQVDLVQEHINVVGALA